jgi:hypothetical protein
MKCQFLIYGMLHTEFHSDKAVLRIQIRIQNQMFLRPPGSAPVSHEY